MPERRKVACQMPIFTFKKAPVLNPFYLDRVSLCTPQYDVTYRGRETNTNFVSQTFRAPLGYPGEIPGYPAKKFGFPGFVRDIPNFGPHPFTWNTPTPPEDIRTKKFGFLLLAWWISHSSQSLLIVPASISKQAWSPPSQTCQNNHPAEVQREFFLRFSLPRQ